MKKIYLTLIALIGCSHAIFGQEAENAAPKTVVEGRTWTYLITGQYGSTTMHNHKYLARGFHFQGTETLEGKTYAVFRNEAGKAVAYMREENDRIYLYTGQEIELNYSIDALDGETYPSEVLLYDFSCKPGESFDCFGFADTGDHYGMPFTAEVTARETITYGANEFMCQRLEIKWDDEPFPEDVSFIEGLGSYCGLLPFPQFGVVTSGIRKEYESLYSVTDADGTVIYKNNTLEEYVNGSFRTDLSWDYYVEYGYRHEPYTVKQTGCSIHTSDASDYPYAWRNDKTLEWTRDDWDGPITEYLGETSSSQNDALLRVEDGRVYVELESFRIPEGELFQWYMCPDRLSICNPETLEVTPYTPEEGEEVVLYDFAAKVGDRYRSIVCGSVVSYVTVTKTDYMTLYSEEGNSIGRVKVVEVFPDYVRGLWEGETEPSEDSLSLYSIRYAEGIGNIYKGNYIYLLTEPCLLPDNGFNAEYVINNVYNPDGSILYKGKDFDGFAGIGALASDVAAPSSATYDLHGRRVTTPVPGSIYIRDGKKFVAK